MDQSETWWQDWSTTGPYQAFSFGVGDNILRGPARNINGGFRARKLYWAPVIGPAMNCDYIEGQFTFKKFGSLVLELPFAWMGSLPNDASKLQRPCLPYGRFDFSAIGSATIGPYAADPDSRGFQWWNSVGSAWGAQFVMEPTRLELDADTVELYTNVHITTAGASATMRQFIMAGVVSGPEIKR
jgi:hypothetical protein